MTTSISPSILEWKVVDIFNWVPIISQSVVQKTLRNLVSLFEIMILGVPKCTQTFSNKMFVVSYSIMAFLQCTRLHIFLKLSTTTNRSSYPFNFVGNPTTKSIQMLSHHLEGIGKGCYNPYFQLLGLLVQQSIHTLIN